MSMLVKGFIEYIVVKGFIEYIVVKVGKTK